MSIKKLGATFVAVLALTAIAASSASAAVTTTAAQWYTGASPGTTLSLGTDTGVTARIPTGGVTTLTGTIGGKAVELSTSTLSCVGCQITNEAVTGKTPPVAVGDGQIRYTNVTVTKPAPLVGTAFPCLVRGTGDAAGSQTVTTRPLKVHADWMDTNTANQHAFIQFFPTEAGGPFASLHFENNPAASEACPIAGNDNVTGTVFGESENNTGVQAVEQPVVFNSTVQTTTGASLLLGANAATLTGTAIFEDDGPGPFGIH